MRHRSVIRMYGVLVGLLFAAPAFAQFTPRSVNDPATGETFHIEASTGVWLPKADMSISSEELGIAGSKIDFKKDLGLTDHHMNEIHVVLRPGRKHKLRFQYIPINYTQEGVTARDLTPGDNCVGIVFNGQCYPVNVPVNSELDWKAFRFTYEYDFITWNRGFAGFMLDAKYTKVRARLRTPGIDQFAEASAPIPAIGGIIRVYPVPNISITGELSGFKIPDSVSKDYKAHYTDLDMYGTVNFTNNLGAQFGFRAFDVGYLVEQDTGSFTMRGVYFGVVARY